MDLREELETSGFLVRRRALGADQLRALLDLVSPRGDATGSGDGRRSLHAIRNLLWDRPALAPTLDHLGVNRIAAESLGAAPFPINAIYFDKTSEANWKVPAHQDLMMPVEREVAGEPGFSGWATKSGVVHVDPPSEVLAKLVALRVHFDDCSSSDGALALIPGSHRRGKLRDSQLAEMSRNLFTICEVAAGDILVMKPLIVHRSSPAAFPSHRRVLHVVYASEEPGAHLRWKRSA
jgi:hypothetical protein